MYFSNKTTTINNRMPINESRTIGANTPAPSNCVIILRLKYPKPACAPSHSPIAAPITLMGTATFKPEKKEGKADGTSNFKKMSLFEAPIVCINSLKFLFLLRKPSNVLMVIGKKVMMTVTTTLLQIVYPNHKTKIGASAIIGIVCDVINMG